MSCVSSTCVPEPTRVHLAWTGSSLLSSIDPSFSLLNSSDSPFCRYSWHTCLTGSYKHRQLSKSTMPRRRKHRITIQAGLHLKEMKGKLKQGLLAISQHYFLACCLKRRTYRTEHTNCDFNLLLRMVWNLFSQREHRPRSFQNKRLLSDTKYRDGGENYAIRSFIVYLLRVKTSLRS